MLVSGSIEGENPHSRGGYTLQRRKHSLSIGARSNPVRRFTPRSARLRSRMRVVLFRWRHVLTTAQRDGWNTYASATPHVNWYGRSTFLRGVNAYAAQQLPRLAVGLNPLDDPPAEAGPNEPGALTITPTEGGDLEITIDPAVDWPSTDGAALVVSCSSWSPPRIALPRLQFATAGAVLGDSSDPPSGTVVIPNPFGPAPFTPARLTWGFHLSDPVKGPGGGEKGGATPEPPPPPPPDTCPCWPPPCGDLLSSYTVHFDWFPCFDCNSNNRQDRTITADTNVPCSWSTSIFDPPPEITVGLDTNVDPPVWIINLAGSGCSEPRVEKATGGTPVGAYAAVGPNDCDGGAGTSSIQNAEVRD